MAGVLFTIFHVHIRKWYIERCVFFTMKSEVLVVAALIFACCIGVESLPDDFEETRVRTASQRICLKAGSKR
jgi:hypothetical protein